MRIAHLGSYGINLGDNVALFYARKGVESAYGRKIDWMPINILRFHKRRNSVYECSRYFQELNEKADVLMIGGGGLIEAGPFNEFETGWKLPLSVDIIKGIRIPIVVHSVGVNRFRGMPRIAGAAVDSLACLIERSAAFSVRNDGSYEILKEKGLGHRIYETCDPALTCDAMPSRPSVANGAFQPAWNVTESVNRGRFGSEDNIDLLRRFVSDRNMTVLPHTYKDYYFGSELHFPCTMETFRQQVTFGEFRELLKWYRKFGYVVAMRGHGQMISYGMNVPGIYFSTQDKVAGFALKMGLSDYLVDISFRDWLKVLIEKTDRLITDKLYLAKWYAVRAEHLPKARSRYDSFDKKVAAILRQH